MQPIPTKEINTQVAEAIFGGPSPAVGTLEAFVRDHALPLPAEIVALPEGGTVGEHLKQAVPLHLHEGIVYWFVPTTAEKAPRPRWFCAAPSHLVGSVQQAILALRRKELLLLSQKNTTTGKAFTLQEEVQAFRHAVEEVRKAPETAGDALEIWIAIVLHRYQQQINAIRLRLVELLTALTRGAEGNFAYISYSLIKRIYDAQHLRELGLLPQAIAREVGPLVISRHGPGSSTGEALSPAVHRAFSYMATAFKEPVSLSEVATACHISPAHLARLFKKETGQSVVAHLQRLRINHARELLATTGLGLLEVAMESGFESIEHFHRLFRRLTGVTPRAYRLAAQ